MLHDPASSLIRTGNFQLTVSQIKTNCYIDSDGSNNGGGESGDYVVTSDK